jgi:uncharacterized protein (TIGR00255 family)
MTGFGESAVQHEQAYVRVEIRTVNNRHFKLSLRCPDGFLALETEFERLLRETISRGSIFLTLRIDRVGSTGGPRINAEVLKSYWQQLNDICTDLGVPRPDPARMLLLPGVLQDDSMSSDIVESLWPVVEQAVKLSAEHLQEFRRKEGESTGNDLTRLCHTMETYLKDVEVVAPQVVREYHEKVVLRTNELLANTDIRVNSADVLREVALLADRTDIHEEITRLRSHISQFLALIEKGTTPGRKMDFLCQEMFREVNTIGSKANHAGLAHVVVELKATIERIREIVQNVE